MKNVTVLKFINMGIGIKLRTKKDNEEIQKIKVTYNNKVISTFKELCDQNVDVLLGFNIGKDLMRLNGEPLIGNLKYKRKENIIVLG